ncbi:uncharacterized protein LOC26526600 [Drosophila erecta]|uniref:uncharacterized protein LOC26526600 n=1 Tax=Drosophila erecta TaxID=7220 RepID=UPI000732A477|nr:uncharacterized protein LOC26526600 [Drosophila erecta]KQS39199.1 uncharacterized protein Dere_GG26776 [Drosophila erecta]
MRFVFLFVLLSILAFSLVSAKEQSKADSSPGGNHVGHTVKPRLRAKRNLFGSRPTISGQIQRYAYGYPYNHGVPTYYRYPYYSFGF